MLWTTPSIGDEVGNVFVQARGTVTTVRYSSYVTSYFSKILTDTISLNFLMKYNTYYPSRKTYSFPLYEIDDEITNYIAKHVMLDIGGDLNQEKDMNMYACTKARTGTGIWSWSPELVNLQMFSTQNFLNIYKHLHVYDENAAGFAGSGSKYVSFKIKHEALV